MTARLAARLWARVAIRRAVQAERLISAPFVGDVDMWDRLTSIQDLRAAENCAMDELADLVGGVA